MGAGRGTGLTRRGALQLAAGAVAGTLLLAGCGGGGGGGQAGGGSTQTSGVTITVALAADPPPKAALDDFTLATPSLEDAYLKLGGRHGGLAK